MIHRLVSLRILGLAAALTLLALPLWTLDAAAEGDSLDAETLVDRMVEAHGGMEAWATAPTVAFSDQFTAGNGEAGSKSRVVVEQGSRRAYIDMLGTEMSMAWDGEKAWGINWESPYPPRFLALLNYYFVNLPWLAKDPGVNLGEPGTAKLWDDPTEYHTVKMTYDPGVGDTPDDYYVLYIHPETYELAANEYIVTYQALLPEGQEHTEPHVLVYDQWTMVNGLKVPTAYTIYLLDHTVYAESKIWDWSFGEAFDTSRMEMPADAVVDTTQP
ncbi:MAG: DUF6503 family protein [Acidobacteriota bacterium]|nr:DUF6503 family protein [Acidobacteriota bacterium]